MREKYPEIKSEFPLFVDVTCEFCDWPATRGVGIGDAYRPGTNDYIICDSHENAAIQHYLELDWKEYINEMDYLISNGK